MKPKLFTKQIKCVQPTIGILVLLLSLWNIAFAETPTIVGAGIDKKLVLPEVIASKINIEYPNYEIANKAVYSSYWKYKLQNENGVPYAAWGDFNGDGTTDVSLILLDKIDSSKGILVIYSGADSNYSRVYDSAGWSNGPLYESIKVLNKGTKFQYEVDDDEGKRVIERSFANDVIVNAVDDGPINILFYENGLYTWTAYGNY